MQLLSHSAAAFAVLHTLIAPRPTFEHSHTTLFLLTAIYISVQCATCTRWQGALSLTRRWSQWAYILHADFNLYSSLLLARLSNGIKILRIKAKGMQLLTDALAASHEL